MIDFTYNIYRQLLTAIQKSGYSFFTFEDWCDGKAHGRYVILRHDVDLKADHSLITARMEAEMGIRSTYYFRIVSQSNQPEIIKTIAGLGHEIGYHYEDLSLFHGDTVKATDHFKQQLEYFRQFYLVRTICMHGSPTSKWDNRDLWKTNDYRKYGVVGEPYLDFLNKESSSGIYLTDTARMWNGDKYNIRDKSFKSDKRLVMNDQQKENSDQQSVLNSTTQQFNNSTIPHFSDIHNIHSTFDFIHWLKTDPIQNGFMITTHPQRWTNKPIEWIVEFIMQHIKNKIKQWFLIHKTPVNISGM